MLDSFSSLHIATFFVLFKHEFHFKYLNNHIEEFRTPNTTWKLWLQHGKCFDMPHGLSAPSIFKKHAMFMYNKISYVDIYA